MEPNNNEDFIDYQEPQIDDSFNRIVHDIFTNSLSIENQNNFNYISSFLNTYSNIFLEEFQEEQEQVVEEFQEQEQEQYNFNLFNLFNPFFPLTDIIDPIETILQESFEINQQNSGLEKTNHIITINSQRYSYLADNIKSENKSCSICIVDFENDDMISITNCNHIYHTDCIKEWGKYKTECPICREPLE